MLAGGGESPPGWMLLALAEATVPTRCLRVIVSCRYRNITSFLTAATLTVSNGWSTSGYPVIRGVRPPTSRLRRQLPLRRIIWPAYP